MIRSNFLRHVINHKGIRPIPEKAQEISKLKPPANIEAQTLLKLLYYKCFIPAFLDFHDTKTNPQKENMF